MEDNARVETIVERIGDLLDLTGTTDAKTAAIAAAEAQKTLDQYNLARYHAIAHGVGDGVGGAVPVVATRHVFFTHTASAGAPGATTTAAEDLRRREASLWQGLMRAYSEHHLCWCVDDSKFRQPNFGYSAGFTVVGDPVNVRAAIALFEWQKGRLEADIVVRWPRFQGRQGASRRTDGGMESFRQSFVPAAVAEIERTIRERRLQHGLEAEIAAIRVLHRAAIAGYASEYMDLNGLLPAPSPGDRGPVESAERETGRTQ